MYSQRKNIPQILFTLLVQSNCLIYYKIYLWLFTMLLQLFCARQYLKVSASRCLKLKTEGQIHSHCPPPKIKDKNPRHLNTKLKISRKNNDISILGEWKHFNNLIKQFTSIPMWMGILKSRKLSRTVSQTFIKKTFSHWKANVIPSQIMILQRRPNQSLSSNPDQALGHIL